VVGKTAATGGQRTMPFFKFKKAAIATAAMAL
jgi:hypothetical protein